MSGSMFYFPKLTYTTQSFSSSTTFTVPDGVNEIYAEIYGAGGGGAGGSSTSNIGGRGGKAGARVFGLVPVFSGEIITVTIGAGGAGGQSGSPALSVLRGTKGGRSSFKGLYAPGGKGGDLPPAFAGAPLGSYDNGLAGYDSSSNGGTSSASYSGGEGGDGGVGNGGNGGTGSNGSVGGTAAGGGGAGENSGLLGGAGGNGFIKIYYKDGF